MLDISKEEYQHNLQLHRTKFRQSFPLMSCSDLKRVIMYITEAIAKNKKVSELYPEIFNQRHDGEISENIIKKIKQGKL